jgi:hypothetical protein
MYLIQILLPRYDNRGRRLSKRLFDETARALATSHGGMTVYSRSPALGLWNSRRSGLKQDEIIVYEVLASRFKRNLWKQRRDKWEAAFRQDSILIRISSCEQL